MTETTSTAEPNQAEQQYGGRKSHKRKVKYITFNVFMRTRARSSPWPTSSISYLRVRINATGDGIVVSWHRGRRIVTARAAYREFTHSPPIRKGKHFPSCVQWGTKWNIERKRPCWTRMGKFRCKFGKTSLSSSGNYMGCGVRILRKGYGRRFELKEELHKVTI